ncbi:methyltransferase-like protein 7B [Chelonus insularis]|uniref:methyltransferase-like protein 7B n=1 Tax=Chelonus insularis TaxID=460826 RepID=UPI00158E7A36|nr:methyltransferase-like protein 7B [Chelonus insularis]
MAVHDLWIRDVLTIYGSLIFGTVFIYYIVKLKWSKFTNYIYRSHLLGFETECAELMVSYKKRLLEPLNNIISKDPVLKAKNCIRLLEIGVKTGQNIPFYPDETHFIGVDCNHKLEEYLTRNGPLWQFAHIFIEKIIVGDGTQLKQIPTGYVDAVVTIRSLCSISPVADTLQEIKRILVLDGQYFFLEHIPHRKGTLTRWLQELLTKTKIWPTLFGDCRLDSNPLKEIKTTGFRKVKWDTFKLQGDVTQSYRLNLTCYHMMGIAKK